MSEMSIETSCENGVIKVFAKQKDKIVGSAFGGIEGTQATLDTIQVNASQRGEGIGSKTLEAFEEEAKKAGVFTITGRVRPEFGLNQVATERFYKKNGYRIEGEFIHKNLADD